MANETDETENDCFHAVPESTCDKCLIARLEDRVKCLTEALQDACDVHERMTRPRGVTNQTMHGCEMCDALNRLHAILAPSTQTAALSDDQKKG